MRLGIAIFRPAGAHEYDQYALIAHPDNFSARQVAIYQILGSAQDLRRSLPAPRTFVKACRYGDLTDSKILKIIVDLGHANISWGRLDQIADEIDPYNSDGIDPSGYSNWCEASWVAKLLQTLVERGYYSSPTGHSVHEIHLAVEAAFLRFQPMVRGDRKKGDQIVVVHYPPYLYN